MLTTFKVENFRSIRDEEQLSMLASRHSALSESLAISEHTANGILPVAAIFGANAAGKTNLVRALVFFSTAVESSHNEWKIDRDLPFKQHFFRVGEPSKFEAEFILDGHLYRYGFKATQSIFIEEWLFEGRKMLYHRTNDTFAFGPAFRGSKGIKEHTRPNALFLSTAIQNNHKMLLPIAKWIAAWRYISPTRFFEQRFTLRILENESAKQFLLEALSAIDKQIVDISESTGEKEVPVEFVDPKIKSILKDARAWETLVLTHRDPETNQEAKVHLEDESAGTQNYLAMLGPIVSVLWSGDLLMLDEANASLHPSLLRAIVCLFQSPKTNPRKAQLIFNTHDTTLLSSNILRPDEVWFAEKNGCSGSHFYSLADFPGIRSDLNAQKSYLDGRFGAVPFLEDHMEVFARQVTRSSDERSES